MPSGAPGTLLILAVAVTASCSRPVVPDPKEAVARYADAVRRGDSDAVYSMMSDEARKAYGRAGTRRLLSDAKRELAAQADAFSSGQAQVQATAIVPYDDGEQATLLVQDGTFRLSAAQALPAGARTPAQALGELRSVLSRRSYPGLIRVLSTETRSAIERDLRSLVEGLEQPQTLPVKIQGDRAEVDVPGGHKVWLRREEGVWRIADFD